MLTYNHEAFIAQAIEGIMMQQAAFEINLFIADDTSTDKTSEICKMYAARYPEKIIHHINKNNLGPTENYNHTLKICTSKYIANCEGDDYWTDPYKLQKQVDFLEQNSDYAICWTKYKVQREKLNPANENSNINVEPDWICLMSNKERFDVDLNNIFNPFSTISLTVLFRRDAVNVARFSKMKYAKDNTLYCFCLHHGKGAILNFYGGVYRIHGNGIFSGVQQIEQHYSSFNNLNEIIRKIPECNTANLRTIRNRNLLAAFNICLLDQKIMDIPDMFVLCCKILMYCDKKDKMQTVNFFLKQIALLIKTSHKKRGSIKNESVRE